MSLIAIVLYAVSYHLPKYKENQGCWILFAHLFS